MIVMNFYHAIISAAVLVTVPYRSRGTILYVRNITIILTIEQITRARSSVTKNIFYIAAADNVKLTSVVSL